MKYNREKLEHLLYTQLQNIDLLNDKIHLLTEQNELLVKFNNKLINRLKPKTRLKLYSKNYKRKK